MSKSHTIKIPKVMPRNPLAVVARQRRAATMHDRRAPRGGTRNQQADFMAEIEDDYDDFDY